MYSAVNLIGIVQNRFLKFLLVAIELCVQIEEDSAELTPRERWTREPGKDQALLALARPISSRRRTNATCVHNNEPSEQESSADPEHSRHPTSSGKRAPRTVPHEVKHEASSERIRKSYMERPKSVAVKKVR